MTYPVTGEVKMNGQPVVGADVAFLPKDLSGEAAGAQAVTDETGRFEVVSNFDQGRTTKPGMSAGEYSVTVTQLEQLPAAAVLTQKPKNLIGAKFAAPATSGLEAVVAPEGENHFVFEVAK